MRLFLAINFTAETRSRLVSLAEELRLRSEQGNFSAPDNLHLTLVFLGECDADQTALAQAALAAVCIKPFFLLIDRIGRFRRDGGDVWWAGVKDNGILRELQRELTAELVAAGFRLERRKYTPHISLGRRVVTNSLPWVVEPFGETINRVDLMKSERVAGQLTYTAIYGKDAGQ